MPSVQGKVKALLDVWLRLPTTLTTARRGAGGGPSGGSVPGPQTKGR